MSEGFNKLHDIGAQKIHEATHIARAHVQAFLDEDFDNMNKIQFLGFVSIFEREYSVDLSEEKEKALEYFEARPPEVVKEDGVKVFIPKKKRKLTAMYLAMAMIAFFVFMMTTSPSTEAEIETIDNSVIETATDNIAEVASKEIEQETEKNEFITSASLKITPTHEVWLGFVNLDNFAKGQKTFMEEFSLDAKKDWLLTFGHGHVTIEVNGIIKKYSNPRNIRFVYKNSELKEIDLEEFKRLNRGNRW